MSGKNLYILLFPFYILVLFFLNLFGIWSLRANQTLLDGFQNMEFFLLFVLIQIWSRYTHLNILFMLKPYLSINQTWFWALHRRLNWPRTYILVNKYWRYDNIQILGRLKKKKSCPKQGHVVVPPMAK